MRRSRHDRPRGGGEELSGADLEFVPENGEGLHLPRGGRRGRRDSDAAGEELELDGAAPLPLLFATSSAPPPPVCIDTTSKVSIFHLCKESLCCCMHDTRAGSISLDVRSDSFSLF
jgi:hypothetical protein